MELCDIVWNSFRDKMRKDELCDCDFTKEMQQLLSPLLCGSAATQRRNKFISSPFETYKNGSKISILVHCSDDDYRFDFVESETRWKLAFIECISLPVSDIKSLPYIDFAELPDKEIAIRKEKDISRTIFMYNKFKEMLGQEEATKIFMDGQGEFICARSWVPFYSDNLSYIAYAAWMENRINGERVIIERFDEEECCLKLCQHTWRKLYVVTGHLQNMIEYNEYMHLFEEIWKDRASASGWMLQFEYLPEDTILRFSRKE